MSVQLDSNSAKTFFGNPEGSGGNTASVFLSTDGTARIILVHVFIDSTTSQSVSSITSTSDLTFELLKQETASGADGYQLDLEVWWAYAPAQLSAEQITILLTGVPSDLCSVLVYAAYGQGSNTAPFDTDAPAAASNPTASGAAIAITGFSTANADDLLIQFAGTNSFGSDPSAPGSGWTALPIPSEPSNFFYFNSWNSYNYQGGQYQNVGATQTSFTAQFDATACAEWVSIVYAIAAGAAGSGPKAPCLLIGA